MKEEQYISKEKISTIPSIKKAQKRDYYPVSLQQEGVWLQSQVEPESTVWNSSHSWRFEGSINLEAFKKAIRELIHRHASLRTNFRLKGDKILQFIHDNFSFDSYFKYFDISSYQPGDKESEAKRLEKEVAQKIYDLEKRPLVRFTVIRLNESDHLIVIGLHHIITDVTSRQILWKELVTLYNSFTFNKPHELEPVDLHYHDYALWQQEFLKTPYYEKQEKYWISQLSSPLPVLNLPFDSPRREKETGAAKIYRYTVALDHELAARLRTFSLQNRAAFSAVFLLTFYILLHKIGGQSDIIIGSLYRGRNINKSVLNKIIGLFANFIAMPLNLNENTSLKKLLKQVDKKTREAYENQDFQFEDLIRTLHPERTTLHSKIFQAVFNMIKLTSLEMVPDGLIRKDWQSYKPDNEISSQYDLSLYVRDEFKKITLRVLYTRDRFTDETIKRIVVQYITILSEMINDPGKKLANINIIPGKEKQQLLYEFNETEVHYPKDKTIQQLFAEQVERIPDHIAVVGSLPEPQQNYRTYMTYMTYISYGELNRKSHQLALILKERGVKPDTIVGLMVKRSAEMMIGILGILKAGGAYLPIDPGFPEERIDFMLKDSNVQFLLSDNPSQHFNCQLSIVNCQLSMNEQTQSAVVFSNLQPATRNPQLAYTIYTSGSTGKPKGVMIPHQAVHNFIKGMTENIDFKPGKTILALTTISFDIFVLETLLPLLRGLRVVIVNEQQQLDIDLLEKLIVKTGIDLLQATPTRMHMFTHRTDSTRPCCLKNLEAIMVGGEPFPEKLLKDLQQLTSARIYNMYGPTETTVWSTMKELTHAQQITIGQPIANTQIYILDKNRLIQPIGVIGELYIGGDGLARGYINRPELSADKFCLRRPGGRLFEGTRGLAPLLLKGTGKQYYMSHKSHKSYIYNTGDLARWLPDGNIEFLGRIDHQVKIRGFRIELGEIENQLLMHNKINEVVVISKEDKNRDKYLCTYFVSHNAVNIVTSELREYLSNHLPDYMVPSYFVQLEKLPLTSNGKVDRNALPIPALKTKENYKAPRDVIEKQLAAIWGEILCKDKSHASQMYESIGINDNFFELGGHSLKATAMTAKIQKQFHVNLSLAQVFNTPTIQQLAGYIKTHGKEINITNDDHLILLKKGKNSAQRLFFIHDGSGEVEAYINFCNSLDPGYNCWGIKAEEFENCAPKNIKIEQLAAQYIKKLKIIQASGPYYIVGWSLGGVIAFEMVYQLEQMNQTVDFFAVIDAPPPKQNTEDPLKKFTLESELNWSKNYLPRDIYKKIQNASTINHMWTLIVHHLESDGENTDAASKGIKKILAQYGGRGITNYQNLSVGQMIRYLNILRSFHQARVSYIPFRKINTPIQYFKASESGKIHHEMWREFTIHPLMLYEIKGDHYSIFTSPPVMDFAKKFEQIMKINKKEGGKQHVI